MKTKVLITVKGGQIVDVKTNTDQVEVVVHDWDNAMEYSSHAQNDFADPVELSILSDVLFEKAVHDGWEKVNIQINNS